MAILRRDETPDDFAPVVLYLWQKKWLWIGAALAVFILTYVAMRLVPEQFRATAHIYVNRHTPRDVDPPNAANTAKLLKNTELMKELRDEFAGKFGTTPVLEKFIKQFTVTTEILQDTAVTRDVSPVVALQVESVGRDETKFLMESWITRFISKFGSYSTEETRIKRDSLLQAEAKLKVTMEEAERQAATYRAALQLYGKLLAEYANVVAPAQWEEMQTGITQSARDSNNVSVVMSQPAQRGPGLLARLADAKVKAAMSAGTSESARAEIEVSAIELGIRDASTSISSLQKTVAELDTSHSAAVRTVNMLSGEQRVMHETLDLYSTMASWVDSARPEQLVGADVRALSSAVTPELRVWPKRTLIAGIAAIAAAIIVIGVLLMHRYIMQIAGKSSEA